VLCFSVPSQAASQFAKWLQALGREDRKIIGEDIKAIQFGWQLGMPLIRKIDNQLWEVRSQLRQRIACVVFTVQGELIVLLHGFIKKSKTTPPADLELARKRLAQLKGV
jgi:phage-related protein